MQAFRLLHDVYVDAGIIAPDARGLRIRAHDLLPTTWTFIARHRGRIVAEVALIGDTPLGLPMEATHAAEVAQVRQRGTSLMECSGLACAPAYRASGLIFVLFGLVYEVLRGKSIATMVMRVNPRQVALYRDVLGCELLGDARADPRLMSIPFTPIGLDITTWEPRIRERFAAGQGGAEPVLRALFEIPLQVLRWPASFTSPSRLDGLAAIVRAYPDLLASQPAEVQRHVRDALAPFLVWPTGASPFVPALARPAPGRQPR